MSKNETFEEMLVELHIDLSEPPRALGMFRPYLIDGEFLYISGQIPYDDFGEVVTGKVGRDLTAEDAILAARYCAIGILARAKAALDGDWARISKVIKLGGFVNAVEDFEEHPKVLNGASGLIERLFGRTVGGHVRFAVGCSSLPKNAAVEIEAVFRIKE